MGRSERWHTADGVAMLAEDAVAEDRRRDASALRAIGTRALSDPSGPGVALWVIDLLFWITRRTFRREED